MSLPPMRNASVASNSFSGPTFKQISSLDQGVHLTVHHAPLQHPEAAIGMNISEPLWPQGLHDILDARCHQVRAFHFVVLDIDQTDSESDLRIEIGKDGQLVIASSRKLQDQMIRAQRIQERNQIAPETTHHGLSAKVAETDMDSLLVQNPVHHVVDGL